MAIKITTYVDATNSSTVHAAAERFLTIAERTKNDASWEEGARATALDKQAAEYATAATKLREAAEAMKRATDIAYDLAYGRIT